MKNRNERNRHARHPAHCFGGKPSNRGTGKMQNEAMENTTPTNNVTEAENIRNAAKEDTSREC
jgi:hypothetical protein